jgi:hypothetical protein
MRIRRGAPVSRNETPPALARSSSREATARVCFPPFATVCWSTEECVLWAESDRWPNGGNGRNSGRSQAMPRGAMTAQLRRPRPPSAMSALRRFETSPLRKWRPFHHDPEHGQI